MAKSRREELDDAEIRNSYAARVNDIKVASGLYVDNEVCEDAPDYNLPF